MTARAEVIPFAARVTIAEVAEPPSNAVVQKTLSEQPRSFAAQKAIWLERILLDLTIPHVAHRIAALIGRHLNRTSGDAWPSQGRLAADLGVTRRTAQRALDDLIYAGYLAVEGSRGSVNHYRPIFEIEAAQPIAREDATSMTRGDTTSMSQGDATSVAGELRQIIRTEPSLRGTFSNTTQPKRTLSKETGTDFEQEAANRFFGCVRKEAGSSNQAAEINPLAASLNLAAEESKAAPPSLRSPPQSSAMAPQPAIPRGLPMDDFDRIYREGVAAEKRERLEAALKLLPPEEFWSELRGTADKIGQCHDWAANRFKDLHGHYPHREWNDQPAAKHPDPDVRDWLRVCQRNYAKSQGWR